MDGHHDGENRQRVENWTGLEQAMDEYLGCYFAAGFTRDGRRFVICRKRTQKDEDALQNLLRYVRPEIMVMDPPVTDSPDNL